MAGLTEVYTGAGADASTRRLALGGGLFAVGVALAALGALFGTTELLSGFGYGIYESRRIAGVLAGFGVPAVFSGIVTVLPATRRVRVAAAGGATLAACGVLWFWMAYPADWAGYGRNLTLPVTALYLLGTTVTFACLFVGVARFKTRNAPGGTVSLDVVRKGETRFVEVERPAGVGSVGLIGTPSDTSETPTAPPETPIEPRGDGGTTQTPPVDRYCGNCVHVDDRTDEGLRPYCSRHERLLESMDACEEWASNTPERPREPASTESGRSND
ncbi:hypothetical protein ACFQKF_02220 [Halalkalicoccus sp. GCM10025322]|uniref:DUF7139 domain-containing protein n=1 Tax=Halalkalicoccus TaxID=332246 RepID=UPI002F96992E